MDKNNIEKSTKDLIVEILDQVEDERKINLIYYFVIALL